MHHDLKAPTGAAIYLATPYQRPQPNPASRRLSPVWQLQPIQQASHTHRPQPGFMPVEPGLATTTDPAGFARPSAPTRLYAG